MKKVAEITPIDRITGVQDGPSFCIFWDSQSGTFLVVFEDGKRAVIDHFANTILDAFRFVHFFFVLSPGYICEMEEIET